MTKQEFLKTEVGTAMRSCVRLLNESLEKRESVRYGSVEYEKHTGMARCCLAQWDVYAIVLRELFGQEYYFSRTDEYFGVCTEDEKDWLFRIEKE